MKIKPEYINNICLFTPKHAVEVHGSFKFGGHSQSVRLRSPLPPDLHKDLAEWARMVCDANAAMIED